MTPGLFFSLTVGEPSATTAPYLVRNHPSSPAYPTENKRIHSPEIALKGGPWLRQFVDTLESFLRLPVDWDGSGAQPPNQTAIAQSWRLLEILSEISFKPISVTPSREEGVTIAFQVGKKWAAIECSNGGEIVAVTSDGTGNPTVWEVPADKRSFRTALDTMRIFLS